MKISHKQFIKYFYVLSLTVWILVSIHIFYLYMDYSLDKKPVKGWTFVEAVFDNISYLPYIWNDDKHELYKSFLFKWCLVPNITWEQTIFSEDICKVKTNNYKTFIVEPKKDLKWSDWYPITAEDIFFTYNEIIKNNSWDRKTLEWYKNTEITLLSWDKVMIEFQKWSIDNQIFFTNYILPKHILKWANLDQYISIYSKTPVFSNCWTIQPNSNDYQSIVFDLTNCEDTYIKYYQLKKFENINDFKNYSKESKKNIVDSYIWQEVVDWFKWNNVVLNKYITLFFNSNSTKLNSQIKRTLTNEIINNIYSWDYENYFVRNNSIFTNFPKDTWLEKAISNIQSVNKKVEIKPQTQQETPKQITTQTSQINDLTPSIQLENNTYPEFFLAKTENNFPLKINFSKWFDKVSVANENQPEYFLKSYKEWDKTALYNISEKLKNLKQWMNKYTIVWYNNNKKVYRAWFNIYYIEKPKVQSTSFSWEQILNTWEILSNANSWDINSWEQIDEIKSNMISVIYFNDASNKYLAERLKEILRSKWVENSFDFIEYSSSQEFQKRLESKEYDIVILWLDIWFKKDFSDLFLVDNSIINPSNYKNPDLSSLINQYFTSNGKIKSKVESEINSIYNKEIPFIFVWKAVEKINVREKLNYNIPYILFSYALRKQFLSDVKIMYKPNIVFSRVINLDNFIEFIKKWLNNDYK